MVSTNIKEEYYQEKYGNRLFQGSGNFDPIGSKNFRSKQKLAKQSFART
jgi:hypothetical protein